MVTPVKAVFKIFSSLLALASIVFLAGAIVILSSEIGPDADTQGALLAAVILAISAGILGCIRKERYAEYRNREKKAGDGIAPLEDNKDWGDGQ